MAADLEVFRYILEVKPIGFLDEMNVVCKRKKVKDDFKDDWKCFVEMGKNVGKGNIMGQGEGLLYISK